MKSKRLDNNVGLDVTMDISLSDSLWPREILALMPERKTLTPWWWR